MFLRTQGNSMIVLHNVVFYVTALICERDAFSKEFTWNVSKSTGRPDSVSSTGSVKEEMVASFSTEKMHFKAGFWPSYQSFNK